MTFNKIYRELKTLADDEKLSKDARNACWIGADAIREKMVDCRDKIKKELENKIHISVDTAYEEVMEEYSVTDYGIGVSDERECNDYINEIAEFLANEIVDDIEGDD